jgi:hypothetical protein
MVAGQPAASGADAAPPATMPTTPSTGSAGCSRDELRAAADAFLVALFNGDAQSLGLDPNFRYTENSEVLPVDGGLWRSRPSSEYARHFLDSQQCSSLTVAVLNENARRIVFGARLLHRNERLLEVETMVIQPAARLYRPEGIIPMGVDRWIEPVEMSMRMSRAELMSFAERYFDSTFEPSLLPPHTADCTCLQNGAPAGLTCGDTPGNERYQQLRFPVVDETAGIVTAIAWNNVLSMYIFKAQADAMQNIEAIGGPYTENSGW